MRDPGVLLHTEAMKVEMWQIDRVTPYAKNARRVPDRAIEKVAAPSKSLVGVFRSSLTRTA
jgi:hypothetical protein